MFANSHKEQIQKNIYIIGVFYLILKKSKLHQVVASLRSRLFKFNSDFNAIKIFNITFV